MKYNNIKKILRKQIDDGVKTFWTYDENKKEIIVVPESALIIKRIYNEYLGG